MVFRSSVDIDRSRSAPEGAWIACVHFQIERLQVRIGVRQARRLRALQIICFPSFEGKQSQLMEIGILRLKVRTFVVNPDELPDPRSQPTARSTPAALQTQSAGRWAAHVRPRQRPAPSVRGTARGGRESADFPIAKRAQHVSSLDLVPQDQITEAPQAELGAGIFFLPQTDLKTHQKYYKGGKTLF